MITLNSLSLESTAYVERCKAQWGAALPKSMIVIEYNGHGDQAFGGSSDDRPLGKSGRVFKRSWDNSEEIAEFPTVEAAHQAAQTIPNRREGSILGVAPTWR